MEGDSKSMQMVQLFCVTCGDVDEVENPPKGEI